MGKVEKYTAWMEKIAADQSHGYSQVNRWGKDYDCSSLIIEACERAAGIPVKANGATYTGNMKAVFLQCGFKDVTKKVNLSTCSGMKRGDVLLNEVHHTAVYCGGGRIVHARGQSYGSPKTGDQGQEIAVTAYYNYPWDCVLRYPESGSAPSPAKPKEKYLGTCAVTLAELGPGCYGQQVKTLQILLKAKGYKGADGKALDCDGEYGDNTTYAVEQLQRKAGMKNIWYGTVSSATWGLVLK